MPDVIEVDDEGSVNTSSMKYSDNVISQDIEETFDLDEIPEKELDKVYRRLDYRIIPALWCLYFLTSYGSSAYGNTLTMNTSEGHSLIQSLNLTDHDTSTASALYYVGYIIFDVPMNLAMTRLSPQVWLSRIVITVGLVYACYAALDNNKGIMAIRFVSGMCGAGTWPGLSYYITLWYPNHRSAKRIGYYFTAAQISAAAAGLVAAGFQKMDMDRGLEGWKWYFLVYGCITVLVGILLLFWLPDRPFEIEKVERSKLSKFSISKYLPKPRKPLNAHMRELHRKDMVGRYKKLEYSWRDVLKIICDIRIWPLIIMYFGVVGTGFGLAVFGTSIIEINNPQLSSIDVSLLYAPIWLFDLAGILIITPIADKFKKYRPLFFSFSTLIIIAGMFVTTYAPTSWSSYGGLLIAGFGLGPTVPITMAWAAEIFGANYGDVGCAVSAALVSGLGNLGSVTATYALYTGWPADYARKYEYSNMMLVVMLGVSVIASFVLVGLLKFLYPEPEDKSLKE
ncbi:hypothetical protein PACTADRAFT_50142 [Pachysolen tannophilus NRRL Y-2460]|uniref:Major facilitator superfamily (MFS) profile domain-containing protein n=1 Tax=Pachysolen tannophilus NRRL Y-2460 TaxID=669874 RepID=A0A1E4TUK5_PACTA|nr:hypothetical protein PACTADRAFT_50142 [Pachysolen tannophilus NRRL Y-2460]